MKTTQKTFFAEEKRLEDLKSEGDPLIRLKKHINWEIFRPLIKKAFSRKAKGPGGRPPFDYVLMFKILILQRMYNLSDHKIQFQIMDRLSFMRFLEISLDDNIPDAKTIWHFRERLINTGRVDLLFNRFYKELKEMNVALNEGSIVDATFIDVPVQRNTKKENDQIKQGKKPSNWSNVKNRQKDIDARWQTKNKEKHFGYKNSIKIGKNSKFIKSYKTTSANTHDSQVIKALLNKREDRRHDLFGDSAYSGKNIAKLLKALNIRNRIHKKGYRNNPLSEADKKRNSKLSKTRARVEHVFGFFKNSMDSLKIRCVGLKRASATIGLMNLTYNVCRYCRLQPR